MNKWLAGAVVSGSQHNIAGGSRLAGNAPMDRSSPIALRSSYLMQERRFAQKLLAVHVSLLTVLEPSLLPLDWVGQLGIY